MQKPPIRNGHICMENAQGPVPTTNLQTQGRREGLTVGGGQIQNLPSGKKSHVSDTLTPHRAAFSRLPGRGGGLGVGRERWTTGQFLLSSLFCNFCNLFCNFLLSSRQCSTILSSHLCSTIPNCKVQVLRKQKKLTDLVPQHVYTTPLQSLAYKAHKSRTVGPVRLGRISTTYFQ